MAANEARIDELAQYIDDLESGRIELTSAPSCDGVTSKFALPEEHANRYSKLNSGFSHFGRFLEIRTIRKSLKAQFFFRCPFRKENLFTLRAKKKEKEKRIYLRLSRRRDVGRRDWSLEVGMRGESPRNSAAASSAAVVGADGP